MRNARDKTKPPRAIGPLPDVALYKQCYEIISSELDLFAARIESLRAQLVSSDDGYARHTSLDTWLANASDRYIEPLGPTSSSIFLTRTVIETLAQGEAKCHHTRAHVNVPAYIYNTTHYYYMHTNAHRSQYAQTCNRRDERTRAASRSARDVSTSWH